MGFLSGLCFSLEKRGRSAVGVEEEIDDGEEPLNFCFKLGTLQMATNFFSESNLLGRGAISVVYKGLMPSGQVVAVKKLCLNSDRLIEFINEVKLLLKVQQRNLVTLLGCCAEGHEMMLVHEYLPNKNLDYILFGKNNNVFLDWPSRFRIITGVAKGLLYLHEEAPQRIIHGDIIAENILLDEQLNPKISNLGMARLIPWTNLDNCDLWWNHLSVKIDVFKFGILALEIVSGENTYNWHSGEEADFLIYAWMLYQEGKTLELVDPRLGDCNPDEVAMCIQVGLLCCQVRAEKRPDMNSVHLMLSSHSSSTLPAPGRPAWGSFRYSDRFDNSSLSFSSIDEGR